MSNGLWTSQEAAIATGGKAVGDWVVSGLSIDTRSLQPGDLFVPLKDMRDGHEFIPQARDGNAGAIMSERDDETAPALIVENSLRALRALAVAARERSSSVRFGVTGSVGKTSLKEAIYTVCATQGLAHKSLKSFNNHWGVPLTLATLPKETRFGVFEMGMNHAGELSELSRLVAPHIAIITKIAPAHLAHFKNVDGIARAKAEIFDGVTADGTAVLNADDEYFEFLSAKAVGRGLKIISFGEASNADVKIENPDVRPGSISANIVVSGKVYTLSMSVDGVHWIENAACAIAATLAAGIEPQGAINALAMFGSLPGRGERTELVINGKSVTLIDESYNANPESMRASIAVLGTSTGRKITVLGDMFELGEDELSLHAALAGPLQKNGVSRVVTVGDRMKALDSVLPEKMRCAGVENAQDAEAVLIEELRDGDTVLVKGSNATGLSGLVAKLKKYKKEAAHVV